MSKKVYRTAQGRMVDLGALQLKNENIRAVGNMSVNARGDLIDSDNRPIAPRNTQVAKQYGRQTSNVKDDMVPSSSASTADKKTTKTAKKKDRSDVKTVPEVVTTEPTPVAETANSGGLAAAIARAREVKQEPILHPRSTGVKKV